MRFNIFTPLIALLSMATCAMAKTTPPPSTRPTSTTATTRPATLSIHQLAMKIRQIDHDNATTPKVAFFDLSQPVVEKPAGFSLLLNPDAPTLQSLIDRLHHAANDKSVHAVLMTLTDPGLNLAESQEVRSALIRLRKAGKKTFVYADAYDTDSYTLATGATDICIMPGGDMMLPGVGLETTFYKGLLDKIGVKADYVQIGEYKGADEEYTRTTPSPQLSGELNKLTDALYAQVVDGIAQNRHLPAATVKTAIDESILTAQSAKKQGFVDHLIDEDGLRDLIKKEIGEKVQIVHDYDEPKHEDVDLSSPFALFSLLMQHPTESTKPSVAVVYADGVIVDGAGGGTLTGGSTIGSDEIRQAMRIVSRDDSIKAVVVRINSPGGSALASEAMWQAVRRVAKDKPVIVSVGSMAASGGYYLASAGDKIYADPAAIIGSIGVVGGKFVTTGLYQKLGLTTESFDRGKNADLFSSDTPFTARQRKMVTSWMRQTYVQFTQRVMTTRKGKIKDIDKVARGRIFIAGQAKGLGMIDTIGGLDKAIVYSASRADLKPGQYAVRTVPAPKTLADLLNGSSADAQTAIRPHVELSATATMLKALPATISNAVRQQLQMLQLLQKQPVILAMPCSIQVP